MKNSWQRENGDGNEMKSFIKEEANKSWQKERAFLPFEMFFCVSLSYYEKIITLKHDDGRSERLKIGFVTEKRERSDRGGCRQEKG